MLQNDDWNNTDDCHIFAHERGYCFLLLRAQESDIADKSRCFTQRLECFTQRLECFTERSAVPLFMFICKNVTLFSSFWREKQSTGVKHFDIKRRLLEFSVGRILRSRVNVVLREKEYGASR